ncbi:MAG: hypothetical protein ACRD4S_06490 [Candidatus Acidiferrales bacterium]
MAEAEYSRKKLNPKLAELRPSYQRVLYKAALRRISACRLDFSPEIQKYGIKSPRDTSIHTGPVFYLKIRNAAHRLRRLGVPGS